MNNSPWNNFYFEIVVLSTGIESHSTTYSFLMLTRYGLLVLQAGLTKASNF